MTFSLFLGPYYFFGLHLCYIDYKSVILSREKSSMAGFNPIQAGLLEQS